MSFAVEAPAPTVELPSTVQRPVPRVLVAGPGSKGRGGISSVIALHAQTEAWTRHKTSMLATYDDRGRLLKLMSAASAYVRAPFLLLSHDLLHVHLAAQTSILRKLPLVWMARAMRRPVVVHCHAPSEASLFSASRPWALRSLFRCASALVALSPAWAECFARNGVTVPVRVVPNPSPVRERRRAKAKSDTAVVLFVGKLEDRKGFADLLAAIPAVLGEYPRTEFRFAGQGALPEAQALAEALGVTHAVHLLGWTGAEALEGQYAEADLLVLPSYAEGVPMSVLEAMGWGLPVVCTPVGGLPDLVQHGENGLFVQPGDVAGIASGIKRLLRDPAFAWRIGTQGQKTVQQRCSLEHVSALLEELYGSVAEKA